jgi:hypothetical protein
MITFLKYLNLYGTVAKVIGLNKYTIYYDYSFCYVKLVRMSECSAPCLYLIYNNTKLQKKDDEHLMGPRTVNASVITYGFQPFYHTASCLFLYMHFMYSLFILCLVQIWTILMDFD